jgi:hypothetical protein
MRKIQTVRRKVGERKNTLGAMSSMSSIDTKGDTNMDESTVTLLDNRSEGRAKQSEASQKIVKERTGRKRFRTRVKVNDDAQSQGSVNSVASSNVKSAKYLKEALENQQTPLILQLSYVLLYVLILGLIFGTLGIELSIRSGTKTAFSDLDASKLPNHYGYYMLMNFDSYLTYNMIADGSLTTTVYDSTWSQRTNTLVLDYNNRLKDDLFAYTQTAASTELFIFNTHNYNMKFPTDTTFQMSMDKFLALIINAVNNTINLPTNQMNNMADDFLFLLRTNIDEVIDFIDI